MERSLVTAAIKSIFYGELNAVLCKCKWMVTEVTPDDIQGSRSLMTEITPGTMAQLLLLYKLRRWGTFFLVLVCGVGF